MPEERLKVSVIVVAYNEEKNLPACLESLIALDYPRDSYEVVVVDNDSTDGTRKVADGFSARDPRVRVVVNPVRGIGATRNAGLRAARHDYAAYTDADCTVPPEWLSRLETAFREARRDVPEIAAAGGSSIAPENTTRFRQAVHVAVQNFWGNHGSVQGKSLSDRTFVDHIPTLNVFYDRGLVLAEGGFDERMGNISEDVELSYRLRWRGYKLLYVPDAAVRHVWRTDHASWIKNMIVYGKGRVWLMKKDLRFFSVLNMVPVGLLLCTLAAPFFSRLPVFLVPLLYVVLTAYFSVSACVKARRPDLVLLVFGIYVLTHYSYGIGELVGLVRARGSDTAS